MLWGDDGAPLAVVEAKRTGRDPSAGQQQAKLFADCLEAQFAQRPVIFYSNGIETWLWDDRTTRRPLSEVAVDSGIVERFYQERAIRRICESFDDDGQRKALVVMATGAGKTRTVIALSDVLIRANWAKRILFLADRTARVKQAANAFKAHLPDSSPVNLLPDPDTDGRVYVSTYQTMMNLIPTKNRDGVLRFGPGHFDLVVIDEVHRSVFAKYRAIFDWFDSLLVGLTATPKTEIDRNTYDLFDLETGVPTDEYRLDAAVGDGFLVPFKAMSVPLKFQREGIRYAELSPEEQAARDELEWDEDDEDPPDAVGAEAVNKWLFNADTVDKVLAHVMTNGLKVDGGDKLAKTIVFAKNQRHAGPGQDKDRFYIFDLCQNLECFGQNPSGDEGAAGTPLSTRLFTRRAERGELAEVLRLDIASMNPDNFVVRPHRRLVEQFRELDAWQRLDGTAMSALTGTLSTLPTETETEPLESKQFDLIVLNLQLAVLRTEPSLTRLQQRVRTIASILEDHARIPAIHSELTLIQDLQADGWWIDATFPMVEDVRRRLRALVALIERGRREPLYTDFTDELGVSAEVDLGPASVNDYVRFRKKALAFMREHEDHLAIQRLRRNQPITDSDVAELERMLSEVGGSAVDMERATIEAGSLGLFVRSLVGMDRAAAKDAFEAFLDEGRYSASQIDYVNLVIEHLAASGTIEPRRFYESPYTDVAPEGPDGLFEPVDVDRLIAVVHEIRHRAEAV